MADLDNINENFDTIKTLLNSIRAQGILNTSDVDKILAGINSKLEKINTDEDIDLIKTFLTELKNNLDERHSVLISKFGAIEALFSNLLKNSSETLKSSEVKELFDIVATNLSVFSREVVSQKETLSDITLRLDAMRSDDSQKRDIIKSISVLKGDVERVTNGFDSIVLSLNENFKTVLKTVSEIDPSKSITDFAAEIADIVSSSNAILSALQLMDKKNDGFYESISKLATKDAVDGTRQTLNELTSKNVDLANAVATLAQKTGKIDSLAEKIDASVSIIAGLKSVLSENEDKRSLLIIDKLSELETKIEKFDNSSQFEEFKSLLDPILRDIISQHVLKLERRDDELKEHFSFEADKLSQLMEANISRTISDIDSNAELLTSRLNDAHSSIAELYEKGFNEVTESVSNLKLAISQLDDNNVSSNNAIYSNISDRLTIFENSLKKSFDGQEDSLSKVTDILIEHITNIKNIANAIDYKTDSSVIEISNSKEEFSGLKDAVQQILNQDVKGTVSNLKTDLYAIKQDLINVSENSTVELNDKLTSDIFGKYELIVSKLDSVEDEIKQVNIKALSEIKSATDNISSSLVDILSYVSVSHETNNEKLEAKLSDVINVIKDSNFNYADDIRNITESIKEQIDENIKQLAKSNTTNSENIQNSVLENTKSIKDDIKSSYDKLLEVQKNFDEIKEVLNVNSITLTTNIGDVVSSADSLKSDFELKLSTLKNVLLDKITEYKNDITCENTDKLSEIKFNAENLSAKSTQQAIDLKNELKCEIENIIDKLKVNIANLSEELSRTSNNLETSNKDIVNFIRQDFTEEVNSSVESIKTNTSEVLTEMDNKVVEVVEGFNTLENSVTNLSNNTSNSLETTLERINDGFAALKTFMINMQDSSSQEWCNSFSALRNDFSDLQEKFIKSASDVDEDMSRQIKIIEGQFDALNSFLTDLMDSAGDALRIRIDEELGGASDKLGTALAEKLEFYKQQIEIIFENVKDKNNEQAEFIKQQAMSLNSVLEATLDKQNRDTLLQLEDISTRFKNIIDENIELTTADYESLKTKLSDFTNNVENCNQNLIAEIRAQLDDVAKFVDSTIDIQAQEINTCFEEIQTANKNLNTSINALNTDSSQKFDELNKALNSEIKTDLYNKLHEVINVASADIINSVQNNISSVNNNINTEINALSTDSVQKFDELKQTLDAELKPGFTNLADKLQKIISETSLNTINSVQDEITSVKSNNENISTELNNSIEKYADKILSSSEAIKQNSIACKELIVKLINEQFAIVISNIEKETDIISGDLIEQISILKDAQKDELSTLTTSLEGSVAGYIIDATNDLKSYLDIKTDKTIENSKLDSLLEDLKNFIDDTTENINKLLDVSIFSNTIDNLKATNEILVTNMADKMNEKIQEFIATNVSKKFDDRMNLFDKKFIDTIVDKYEEIKLLSTQYNKAFDNISISVQEVLSAFATTKDEFSVGIKAISDNLSSSISELKQSFADLKAQIMNKSFDEAFHASVHNQISGIEKLVNQEFSYLEDISELCGNNLPELTEMNTIIKYGIQKSLSELSDKINKEFEKSENTKNDLIKNIEANSSDIISGYNNQGQKLLDEISTLKTDIITQFINIFNQISFVTEQEEIIDFIQEKHSELIDILSRIENNTVEKIDSLKNDISQINKKISAIISSDNDVDYIYSLQDLESDIANLRIVLNDMKESNNAKELEELINSTNNIYGLVESIKTELPKFNADEFKKDFDNLSEDIVSISTRTNKLILTSDESYKTLQDNLQDFRLVINDLDERTRNFAHDAGIDKIDNKLSTLNTMVQNGAKTNQVFNQVFEYLAEWVDKAGAQIEAISDKVETLDDIGQIKVMLEDLKAESADNSESDELVEALGNIFDKQAKKISSLESKLDRIIVENTINSKNNKIDMLPFENTLNKFLAAMDEKMSLQQDKINILETKLEEVVSLVDNKDTVQLTKKVGGMDKQLAKLNKSIEKIASNVIEK